MSCRHDVPVAGLLPGHRGSEVSEVPETLAFSEA